MQDTTLRSRFLHPSGWPIAIKLLFAFLITGMLPVLLTAYYGVKVALSNAESHELRVLEQIAISATLKNPDAVNLNANAKLNDALAMAAQFNADSNTNNSISMFLIDGKANILLGNQQSRLVDWLGADLADNVLQHKNVGSVAYRNLQTGQDELLAWSDIPGQGMRVAVVERGDGWVLPLRQALRDAFVKILLVAVTAALFAFMYFGREIILPIRALTETAKAVRSGDYSMVKNDAIQDDEIGEFTSTFNTMVQSIKDREKERDVFGRMVSPEVREKLLAGQIKLGGENRHVAVLITDIRDFTSMCEGMAPEEIVDLLNSYLTEMTEATKKWKGYVNNFLGDAVIVLFGAPESHDDPSGAAVHAAFEMRERLGQFNIRQERAGKPIIRSGAAVATGTVIAGQMGSLERFQYTVIGDAVNVAARLETLTKEYVDNPILISEATRADIKDAGVLQFVPMGEQMLKGRTQPVKVFAVYKPPTQTSLPL